MNTPKHFLRAAAEQATGMHYVAPSVAEALAEKGSDYLGENPPIPWLQTLAARKGKPGHCSRCCRPSDRPNRVLCTRCKDKAAEARHRTKALAAIMREGETDPRIGLMKKFGQQERRIMRLERHLEKMAALERRLISAEGRLDRMALARVKEYQEIWAKGFYAGMRKSKAPGHWEPRTMSKQEAATISHAHTRKS